MLIRIKAWRYHHRHLHHALRSLNKCKLWRHKWLRIHARLLRQHGIITVHFFLHIEQAVVTAAAFLVFAGLLEYLLLHFQLVIHIFDLAVLGHHLKLAWVLWHEKLRLLEGVWLVSRAFRRWRHIHHLRIWVHRHHGGLKLLTVLFWTRPYHVHGLIRLLSIGWWTVLTRRLCAT